MRHARAGLRARIGANALLVLIDDEYVEGASPTVARTDAQGNTWAQLPYLFPNT